MIYLFYLCSKLCSRMAFFNPKSYNKTTDTTMSFQKIEYNGFRFKFYCYDNEEIRLLQLALIQSDLIQAVGRARTLRMDAMVEVYSNFPLRISDNFIY